MSDIEHVALLPQLGCMAYLQEMFGHSNLSESAKELFLPSWRSKTSQAYDSHFGKWLCRCTERGCDPTSGSISDVANSWLTCILMVTRPAL